ncbi:MAG TPA: hypothetical protein VFS37_06020, partial [Conexibacter sp.]|nr:hypothetical protein [Conexibacter sp.]
GTEGFGLLPMPPFGVHLVLYVTFAGAIVVALVRRIAGDRALPLTAALAWSGIFGLGAGAYFVGRSHPHVLINLFSAWALALVLLVLVVVQRHTATRSRWPSVAELLVLAGFGVVVGSLAQTPTPWSQVDRVRHPIQLFPGAERAAGELRQVVADLTRSGEPVALMMREGHRVAEELGLVNVTPYANLESMLTIEQWQQTLRALRAAGGTQLIVPNDRLLDEQVVWLIHHGYELSARVRRPEVDVTQFIFRSSGR